ncbi:MAG: CBS domain-containing protein [Flavobacteriales bacterium]|nr:CBS domain-containing protein [Flavobacteriales bacterium]
MELYLDSADIKEIDEAFKLGFLTGLTTTPTFMHRGGVTNIDKMILDLAKKVPILQVEALGETAEEVVKEAKRQLKMGLKKETTVFKIPVSLEGLRACRMLRNDGIMVNVHLVYTLQQAYMAMQAGASYVCPLVGRLQDQGHDALSLVQQCVEAVNYYGYDTKIMFSSVRTVEHVRNAVEIGVHTITVPWKLMRQLTDNHFTAIGTQQFYVDTRLITMKVKDVLTRSNPTVKESATVSEALVAMTKHGFGAVMVVDAKGKNKGVFTDGGLRRGLEKEGNKFLAKKLSAMKFNAPFTISPEALLDDAQKAFKEHKVDTLSVSENGKQLGMLDIQDPMKAIAG